MSSFRWTLVAAVGAAGICVAAESTRAAGAKAEAGGTGQVVVLRLDGPLMEAPPEFDFGFDLEPQQSLHNLLDRLRKARKDPEVKAVLLTFESPMIGWGQMQELRQAVTELRAADKDVYCYLEEVDADTYQLATAASRICIVPTGHIDLIGLHIEQAYFKQLLDKIGVEADVEHVGAYKGAGEPFTRTGPSDEAQEMLDSLVDDLFGQMVDTIARGRQISKEQVRELIDRGPFTARQALDAKLVDELLYADQIADSLRQRYGQQVEFSHNYGAKEGPEIDFSSPWAVFKFFGEAMSEAQAPAKPSVAVVYVDGLIVPGRSERGLFGGSGIAGSTTLRRTLAKARKDSSVKAVVLRVDSPGGSATASDIIWHATTLVGKEKPLVVSMGNVAASGGYYVSAGAGTIFADQATITGSIGVLGGKLITKGLWDWLGVSFHEVSRGQNADLYNSNRKFDERQRALVREYMQSVYDAFTDRVKKGRGDRLKKELDQLAGGRVFTGRQAQENGLVDRIGGLSDAIKFAASEANVSDYEIQLLPEPANLIDLFIQGLTGEEKDEGADVAIRTRRFWTLEAPGIRELLQTVRHLDQRRAGMVLRSLLRIELLGQERALLVLPAEIIVR